MKKSRSQLKVEIDKLKRENVQLKEENAALAAGACNFVVGDDGGSARCRKLQYILNTARKAQAGERVPMESINEILAAIPPNARL
jgi:cell division protein FtsB